MKDCTPYLQDKVLDIRFEKALEMIGSAKDKVILDLNCGTARMLQYMPEDFIQYIGNDINEELLEIARKWKIGPIIFICCRDNEIMDHLKRVDIFMCFGINAGVNKGIESETEFETFKEVIKKFLPETVVCEGWNYYEKNYKTISQRADFLKSFDYKEIGAFFMTDRTLKSYRRQVCM